MKVQAFTEMARAMTLFSYIFENIVGKRGENAAYQHFLLFFPTVLSKDLCKNK